MYSESRDQLGVEFAPQRTAAQPTRLRASDHRCSSTTSCPGIRSSGSTARPYSVHDGQQRRAAQPPIAGAAAWLAAQPHDIGVEPQLTYLKILNPHQIRMRVGAFFPMSNERREATLDGSRSASDNIKLPPQHKSSVEEQCSYHI